MPRTAPESVLRSYWLHLHTLQLPLSTADGRDIHLKSPGHPNHDAGPDFLNAVLRIGRTVFAGDIEIHQSPADWFRHRHHNDPRYNRVILHVVGHNDTVPVPARTRSGRLIPLLILGPHVPATMPVQGVSPPDYGKDSSPDPPCCTQERGQSHRHLLWEWIDRLAEERFHRKSQLATERLVELAAHDPSGVCEERTGFPGPPEEIPAPTCRRRSAGPAAWDQVLYEMVAEALGFSRNRAPFILLARNIPLSTLLPLAQPGTDTALAVLFGASGLLPPVSQLPDKEARAYVRYLRTGWRNFCSNRHPPLLHETEWLFFRLRPANFPTARIAALGYLLSSLFREGAFQRIEDVISRETSADRGVLDAICTLFRIRPGAFWQHHVSFRGMRSRRGVALGAARFRDILVNAVVPLLLASARWRDDARLLDRTLRLPRRVGAGDHRLLRTMRRRLWKRRTPRLSAWDEQGVLEWYYRYCEPERCDVCLFGTTPSGDDPRSGALQHADGGRPASAAAGAAEDEPSLRR